MVGFELEFFFLIRVPVCLRFTAMLKNKNV